MNLGTSRTRVEEDEPILELMGGRGSEPRALSISRVRPRALLAGELYLRKFDLEHLACPSASAPDRRAVPVILSLSISRVRPRAPKSGGLGQHKLPLSLSRVHPRAL